MSSSFTSIPDLTDHPAAWRGDELLSRQDWTFAYDPATLDGTLTLIQDRLENGSGAAMLRGYPVPGNAEAEFLSLSSKVGTPVSQSANGERIFSVRDAGLPDSDPRMRGPITRKKLSYHTDRCDVIGFMCLRQAKSGGENDIVSSVSIFNEIRRERPDLLEVLMQPFYYLRHTVDTGNDKPWCRQPVFSWYDGHFAANLLRVLIERAHAHPDLPDLTDLQREALDFVESVAERPEMHLTFLQQPGDILFLNNWVTLHRRSAFEDYDEPEKKRHILRVWLSMPNSRPLHPDFKGNYGATGAGEIRGGMRAAAPMTGFDPNDVPSPAYVVSLDALEKNARLLDSIRQRTGAKVLLACKSFSMFSTFPLLRQYLDGVCCSGLHEARLAREEFGKEVHTYSPGFQEKDIGEILSISDHLVFNSGAQWERFRAQATEAGVHCGLRINPEVSQAAVPLYDPCGIGSRLGIRAVSMENIDLTGISGFSFHALCEQDSFALEKVLDAVEEKFGKWLHELEWLNFGGGHFITSPGYDIDHLCSLITRMAERYKLQIYLEPGSAVALNAGVLVATVVDIVENDGPVAILDTSATTHMPDTLEMPYEPRIQGAETGVKEGGHIYRLGGPSCLAGDFIGQKYTFPAPLEIGQKLVFEDMAHYTMVKTTTFNGIPLPAIATHSLTEGTKVVREFGYEDFKTRLS